jgi:putative membrane protein
LTLHTSDPPSIISEAVFEAAAGLPFYLANLSVALLLLTLAMALYALLAGRADLVRARQGEVASAVSIVGVLIGFALPLASVTANAGALLDLLLWGVVALGVQLVAVLMLRCALRGGAGGEGSTSTPSVLHGALAVAVGLINAAAVFY